MVLCLLKLVWWDSSVRLCNWYLIDSRDLVLDCFCVSKVILILCEDTCMLPKESLASLSAQVYILQLTDQLDTLRAVCVRSCSVVDSLTNTISSLIETLLKSTVFLVSITSLIS